MPLFTTEVLLLMCGLLAYSLEFSPFAFLIVVVVRGQGVGAEGDGPIGPAVVQIVFFQFF